MKFTVELEDFWLEEEEINQALSAHIKHSVVSDIKNSIKDKVDAFMNKILKDEIENQLKQRISVLMDEFLKTGKVKANYGNDMLTIEEWMALQLKSQNDSILSHIKKQADAQGADLKRRYDLLFASQIVAKINEQGLLKEDVAKLLLPTA